MKLEVLMVLSVLVCAATANAEQPAPVISWLDKNAKTFAAMITALNITAKSFPPGTKGTLLVPSDKAVADFLQRMHFTEKEFLANKQLVDLVVAYHFIPGYTAKTSGNVPTNPTIAATGDVNYILRFYKASGPKGPKVWVQDVQDNNVTLEKEPIVLNKVAVVPINQVLMGGGYFFSGKDALKSYPQWSDAFNEAEAAGFPVFSDKAAEQDVTMFVPENSVVQGAKPYWQRLSKDAQKQQLLYHFARPALSIPRQLKTGKLPTLLEGHSLMMYVTNKPSSMTNETMDEVPDVVVTPEVGEPVEVVILNIFAGRSILHGVNGSLQANLSTTTAAKTAPLGAAKPLPKAAAAKPSKIAVMAAQQTEAKPGRRHLLRGGRGGGGNSGYNQMAANTAAASNTARAIDAAASGHIPASAATTYGSYQAQAAAANNGYCYNCRGWY